jgi:hypothetical protein
MTTITSQRDEISPNHVEVKTKKKIHMSACHCQLSSVKRKQWHRSFVEHAYLTYILLF